MLQRFARWEPWLFALAVLAWLMPVLTNAYFVTGDGPCHLYNSRLLNDFMTGNNVGFLDQFYFVTGQPFPNWLFNLITAPILFIAGPIAAERTFFVLYVLCFCYGFRYFLTKINPDARFLAFFGILACYNKILMAGFLNNAASLALWFWVASWWWSHRSEVSWKFGLKASLGILLIFSAHPLGLVYCGMTIGALVTGGFVWAYTNEDPKSAIRAAVRQLSILSLAALPALALMAYFIKVHNWTNEGTGPDFMGQVNSVIHLSPLRILHPAERHLAKIVAFTSVFYLLMAIILRLQRRKWHPADGLLLLMVTAFLITLWPPSFFSGGLDMAPRMAILPFFTLLFWSATVAFPNWAKILGVSMGLGLMACFLYLRLPIHNAASQYAAEVRACSSFIQDTSTLLTLNYNWEGQQPGASSNIAPITKEIWLFTHIDCYLGTDKSLAISDNYEVNFAYFPLTSKFEHNFYFQTAVEGVNFDHRPPRASMLAFKQKTGINIDYVLVLCAAEEHAGHPYTQEVLRELAGNYEKIYASESGRVVLYRLAAAH